MDFPRTYDYPRPAVTVDIILFRIAKSPSRMQVLLVQRADPPFAGAWAVPGGFVRENEDLIDAAQRELTEETGLTEASLQQVATIGTPRRDPRGHTVTVVFTTLVDGELLFPTAGGDAAAAQWFDVDELPTLAFDHDQLVPLALESIRNRLGELPTVFELLPKRFTLSELQELCETILGRDLDPRNFRRRIQELGIVAPTEQTRRAGAHRPAQLFRFDAKQFAKYTQKKKALPF